MRVFNLRSLITTSCIALSVACSSSGGGGGFVPDSGVGGSGAFGGGTGATAGTGATGGGGSGATGGAAGGGGVAGGGQGGASGAGGAAGAGGSTDAIPTTCSQAALEKSHFGCEFWPTVTPTLVWSVFDFAVLVVNPGSQSATVTVTGGAGSVPSTVIPAHGAQPVYLPWLTSIKGADTDSCGTAVASGTSMTAASGAYKLSSDVPVAIYQHSPIESRDQGGPTGKSWSSCPGYQQCSTSLASIGCYSFSADGSLLFPTSSLGTSYRVMGWPGWTAPTIGPYVAITGTQSSTQVTVTLSASAALTAGGVVSGALSAGQTFSFTVGAGDIALLQAPDSADLSGTTIDATKPIQVLSGQSCQQVPEGTNACDHLEESLLPVTAYGKHYLVPVPEGPKGDQPGHALRFFGLQDNTTLSYSGTTPTGAPIGLNAGQTAYLSSVTDAFEVTGDKPFGIVSYLLGGALLDPNSTPPNQLGDPSSRTLIPVEQFRKTYAVALPPGYASSHIEIVMPMTATLQVDGAPVTQSPTAIGSGSFGVLRIPESSASFVSHTISGNQPFGVQLLGYDSYTSHAEPGGMNVGPI